MTGSADGRGNGVPMRALSWFMVLLPLCVACSSTDGTTTLDEAESSLVEEVKTTSSALHHRPSRSADKRAVNRSLVGFWRTQHFQRGAWVDLIWVMGKESAWHAVIAYADEAMTIPLLRWDIVRSYRLDQRSAAFPDAYELTWTDRASTLTAYVDDPGLFASLGIDDCTLQPNAPVDLSIDNCGAPLFPFRECDLKDFVELTDAGMTFGDPTQGDRCVSRPTRHEGWTFERVPFSLDLLRALMPRR